MSWGYHLVLDCHECNREAMKNSDHIHRFAHYLVKRIDMVAYGDPQIVHFGSDDKEGFTLIQLIETSNISAHFANESGRIFLDVFSCKEFDPLIVIEVVNQFFSPKDIHERFIERD